MGHLFTRSVAGINIRRHLKGLIAVLIVAGIAMVSLGADRFDALAVSDYKGVSISPASNRIELTASQIYTGEVKISNTKDRSRDVNVEAGTYNINNSNYGTPDYDNAGEYSEMKNWVAISEPSFTLAPGEEKTVKYVITVPDNPPAGTQYASILVSNNADDTVASGINVTSRAALIITAQMQGGKTNDRSNISSHNIAGYQPTSPLKASFAVKNEGNVSTATKYTLTVRNAINGTEVYNSGEQQGSVYPESTRSFDIKWKGMGVGFYNVELKISLNGRDHTIKQFVVAVPIWIFIAIIIGILCLVGYAILNFRMVKKAKSSK